MAQYEFVTRWRVAAPVEQVWDVIANTDSYPAWWGSVTSVNEVEPGDENGIGAVQRFAWKTSLPFDLVFNMRATQIEPYTLIEGETLGDLPGIGRWQFTADGEQTLVEYTWVVRLTGMLALVEPVARPMFGWNHDTVMESGAKGLSRRLGVDVTKVK